MTGLDCLVILEPLPRVVLRMRSSRPSVERLDPTERDDGVCDLCLVAMRLETDSRIRLCPEEEPVGDFVPSLSEPDRDPIRVPIRVPIRELGRSVVVLVEPGLTNNLVDEDLDVFGVLRVLELAGGLERLDEDGRLVMMRLLRVLVVGLVDGDVRDGLLERERTNGDEPLERERVEGILRTEDDDGRIRGVGRLDDERGLVDKLDRDELFGRERTDGIERDELLERERANGVERELLLRELELELRMRCVGDGRDGAALRIDEDDDLELLRLLGLLLPELRCEPLPSVTETKSKAAATAAITAISHLISFFSKNIVHLLSPAILPFRRPGTPLPASPPVFNAPIEIVRPTAASYAQNRARSVTPIIQGV